MIIAFLVGGLGNQMFQYAAARRLAEKHSTSLRLDITGFETYKLQRYGLHCFHIWEYLASQTEIECCLGYARCKIAKLVRRLGARIDIKRYANSNLRREKSFRFDSAILDAPDNIYLDGYWQSERYFADIREILMREFTIKYPQDAKSREISQLIEATRSVSLHIRRGDYVENPITYQSHGTCSLDYYQKCVDLFSQRVKNPHFFVFSDDPQWAKENLKTSFPLTIISHNLSYRNYEDLRLMSQCKHNIIANSSFSWWGAWLNPNPDKLVCAPKKWFNDQSIDVKDLLPHEWIKID